MTVSGSANETSGSRDPRLGAWGLYTVEGVERVGLAKALEDTANHIAFGIDHLKSIQDRNAATAEIDRLRMLAARERRTKEA